MSVKRVLVSIVCLLLSGCIYQHSEVKGPTFDEQVEAPKPTYANGSIWQASSGSLAEDLKARRKGDLLTIVINEQASASKEANTSTGRNASMSAGIPNLMGLETRGVAAVPSPLQEWFNNLNLDKLVSASTSSDFKGSGATSRKENLSGTITVKVMDVLPNGNLLVEGRRNIKVNNEDQVMVLNGTVRSRDVSPDNTVNSVYVADAKISYSGTGVISDRQKPGWMMNLLDYLWPF